MASSGPTAVALPAASEQVAVARRLVRQTLAGRAPDEVIADLELVASELFTNAVLHGAGRVVYISVERTAGLASVTVASEGDAARVGDVETWALAEPPTAFGRGLAIVRTLADSVSVTRSPQRLTVTARRSVG